MDEYLQNIEYESEIIQKADSTNSLKQDEHYKQTYLELAVEQFYCALFERNSFWKHTGLEKNTRI